MGKFGKIAPSIDVGKLTDDHVEIFVQAVVEKKDVLYDPTVIKEALKGLRMPKNINDMDPRATQFCSECSNRLNAVDYGKSRTQNPEQSVKLLMQYVYPDKLKEETKKCTDLNRPIRRDVKTFIARLSVEAASCQTYGIAKQLKISNTKQNRSGQSLDGKKENLCVFEKPTVTEALVINFPSIASVQRKKKSNFTRNFADPNRKTTKSNE